jgi:hypothetical protein
MLPEAVIGRVLICGSVQENRGKVMQYVEGESVSILQVAESGVTFVHSPQLNCEPHHEKRTSQTTGMSLFIELKYRRFE